MQEGLELFFLSEVWPWAGCSAQLYQFNNFSFSFPTVPKVQSGRKRNLRVLWMFKSSQGGRSPLRSTGVAVGTGQIHWKCLLLGWSPSPCPAPDTQRFPNLRRIEELLPGASMLVNTSSSASLARGGVGPSACGTCGNLDPSLMGDPNPT